MAGRLAAAAAAALVPVAAWASMFAPVTDQQLVCESVDIVRGTVLEVSSAWEGDPEAIWTRVLLRVDRNIRGERVPGELVDVKEIGGTVGDYTIVAHQFPTFRQGEEVVVMLAPWDDGSGWQRVWGYGRGMFAIARQQNGLALAHRHDVIESRRPTMHTDRIPPVIGLDELVREMHELSAHCAPKGGAR
ncbi:MAG TPA: hypothetical protein VJV23_03010 [Candidatus Polarisedimenticolia bacterium]|nr:hypothetical protein [Candidatus Polarisedimenticolia bacterium]